MLPAPRPPGLTWALTSLSADGKLAAGVRLRVGLLDGSGLEGDLISASPEHLSLLLPSLEARYLRAAELRSLHLATPRRAREWALAGVAVAGTTAALVGLAATIPWEYVQNNVQRAFVVLFYAGAGLLSILLAKTRLRAWLTRWECLFDAGGP